MEMHKRKKVENKKQKGKKAEKDKEEIEKT